MAPEDIVGKIRDNAFQVTLEIFFRVMNIPRIYKLNGPWEMFI